MRLLLLAVLLSAPGSLWSAPSRGLSDVEGLPAFDLPATHAPVPKRPERATTSCEDFDKPVRWSYCVTRTNGSESKDVLYYLHGKGGNKKTWVDGTNYSQKIMDRWADGGKQAPIVVTISFGKVWLLAEKNKSSKSGLYEFFLERAMPHVEDRLGAPVGARLLLGESMGGFNGAQLILKKPELFDRAALVCPAIGSLSPYDPPSAKEDYIRRTHARRWNVEMVVMLLKNFFPDQAAWEGSAPLTLGKSMLGATTPDLYVSCGNKDPYGFFEGAQLFALQAKDAGVPLTWIPLAGGHCAADPASIAGFLLP